MLTVGVNINTVKNNSLLVARKEIFLSKYEES
jgi:hypothetical protein